VDDSFTLLAFDTISPLSVGAKEEFMTVSVTGAIAEGWSYYD
jgi:hypothetical protein